jgi:hypothetical protein
VPSRKRALPRRKRQAHKKARLTEPSHGSVAKRKEAVVPIVLSMGPLVAALFLADGAGFDTWLWAGVALCTGLAAARPRARRVPVGPMAVVAAVCLGSLALVAPTP